MTQREISVTGEARYIVRKAMMHDSRSVTLNGLVFFSTETGDAWLLDPDDQLALCLARGSVEQRYRIIESTTKFMIEWQYSYQISGDAFVVTAAEGQRRTIVGYPIEAIADATRSTR